MEKLIENGTGYKMDVEIENEVTNDRKMVNVPVDGKFELLEDEFIVIKETIVYNDGDCQLFYQERYKTNDGIVIGDLTIN